jgi:Gamma-aminobutyrate permease and related permeases
MLYNLSLQRRAPEFFGKLSSRKVPRNGILFSAVFLLIGVVLNYLVPGKAFTYVTSVGTFAALWVWAIIVLVQMKFRQELTPEQRSKLQYPMPGYPVVNWICLAFLAFVAVVMCFDADTLVAMIVGPIWLLLLIGTYYLFGWNHTSGDGQTIGIQEYKKQ